jgi:hypothetical protein|tara:strand:- start:308 stop:475 length:168 start_codon:yes stop_codon:yes gene_type:complete
MANREFMEKNLTGSRKGLYRQLRRGIWQSDNEANVQTESLWYQTLEQVQEAAGND